MNRMDRRRFVERTSLAGLSLLGLNLGANRANAAPEAAGAGTTPAFSPDPDIYSFQFGGSKAFVILDGILPFANIQPLFAPEATKAQIDELVRRDFISTSNLALCVNVLVLRSESGVVLFDAGAGRTFGPTAGRLLSGLARIGVKQEEVKTIYVTHAHSDHIGGLVDNADAPLFPFAKVVLTKNEVSFWTSDSPDVSGMRLTPDETAGLTRTIKKILGRLQPKLELREPGELSVEVEMIAAPGHTPGHAVFRLTQGGESMLVIGDTLHISWLEFAHPEWTMAYDAKPEQAVATRRKLFQKLADNREAVFGYHLPFPGLGHVRAMGGAFEWVPRLWA